MLTHRLQQAGYALPWLFGCAIFTAQSTTLDQTLAAAEQYLAEISANHHQVNALNNMADSAMQLPAPKLKVGIENFPVSDPNAHRFTRSDMTMQRVGIMQDYVSSTKRERKSDAIRAEARKAEANQDVIRTALQREALLAWFDLALGQHAQEAIERLLNDTQRQLGMQKAGVASASSVLALQLTVNEMKNQLDNAKRDVEVARSRLKQLTGTDITRVSGDFPVITRLPASQNALVDAIKQHPEIIQAAREADAAKAKSEQSAVAAIPDVGVEVYYGKRADGLEDMGGVMLTVDLPLFKSRRQDKDYASDLSRTYEANDQLILLTRAHQAALDALIAQYQAAKSIYDRQVNEVVPLQRSRLKLLDAEYRTGSGGLAENLDTRRALLNSEIEQINAQKTLAASWAAIRYLIPQDTKLIPQDTKQ
ncbi:MAG: TolC family protein [Symbiopectobacterium sp.]|uniref:TolC family protein n=1 Tax=Symbiopectobacterium sp. TaxID=2952789 RepID=UPI0039E92F0C